MPDPSRIFISHKHKVQPDQSVVDQAVEATARKNQSGH
jgi:hypothetical protein